VLYEGQKDKRKIFTTKGPYTSWLRRDWQLFADSEDAWTVKKDRGDHRHHALDAVVVALTDVKRIKSLAYAVQAWELANAEGKQPPKRKRLDPPWGTVEDFRKQVIQRYENLIVCHRPARRRIAGELHKEEHFGPTPGDENHFTKRIFAMELTANHLRVPRGWEGLRQKLENAKTKAEHRSIRRQMLALEDVPPAKSGIVRDRWFRQELRDCLRRNGFDPDSFSKDKESKKRFKEFIKDEEKGLLLRSGVPVRRITLLRSLGNPVKIPRKQFNLDTCKMIDDTNPKSLRVYDSQNNHHIEIRENKKGKWVGEVITNFDAAKRVRPPRSSGQEPKPAVNRDVTEKGTFVMSLSIGEMAYMKHPETRKPNYFVVFKIDSTGTIHFTAHTDAGRDKETEKSAGREDIRWPGKKTGGLTAAQLQTLGVQPSAHAQKVWVGPLGDVKVLVRD
jgi:CRISPR-associated endonuclease Csn1